MCHLSLFVIPAGSKFALLLEKGPRVKLAYVSLKGVEAYNDYLRREGNNIVTNWPKPEYDIIKGKSLSMQNEVNLFFSLLNQILNNNSTYYPRSEVRRVLEESNIRSADNIAHSIYKGIWKNGTAALVYHFGITNRDESDESRSNLNAVAINICNIPCNSSIPLIIMGYSDGIPISIVNYSNILGSSGSKIPAKHFHLSYEYTTYYFPLKPDSFKILSKWENHSDWIEYCLQVSRGWGRLKGNETASLLSCNLMDMKKLTENTGRPLNILLHDHQINAVRTLLNDAPERDKILLNPISPEEFALLFLAVSKEQTPIFPDHLYTLEPSPLPKQ